MIDAILTNTMLPAISGAFLNRMLEGGQVTGVRVSVVDGDLSYAFE
jgi:type VI secretion system protein VasG